MTPPLPLSHALLRPAVLQILRATGYHSARTSVIDSVTDLAARYFLHLCQVTALYAAHTNDGDADDPFSTSSSSSILTTIDGNGSGSGPSDAVIVPVPAPTIVDVRMALQRAGALLPERLEEEQAYFGVEDMRGVEGFIAWAMGPLNREIKRIALDGEDEAGDYLDGEFSFLSFFFFLSKIGWGDQKADNGRSTQKETQQK
jgi:transcription initiation factor TFIID subunit 3